MKIQVEICCGSATDALAASQGGAQRIELNSALSLGGLTPSPATLTLAKQWTGLPVIAMVRCRGAGFCYSEKEFDVLLQDARILLENGADGIAFGALSSQRQIQESQTRAMIDLAHQFGKEFVFHRAFDCLDDGCAGVEQLIRWGADRLLSSGQKATASQGADLLKILQERYGDQIEILGGSGIHAGNAAALIRDTGLRQIHSSCRHWVKDPTTQTAEVSYAMDPQYSFHYDCVSEDKVRALVNAVAQIESEN